MFQAGQCVVYPLHGLGYVEEIREVARKQYYAIRIPSGNIMIQIPAERAQNFGMRLPKSKAEAEEILKKLGGCEVSSSDNWNLRFKENWELLRSGNLEQVVAVVKCLQTQENKKRLSMVENRLFGMAKQILLSELVFSLEINDEKAVELLAKWLNS